MTQKPPLTRYRTSTYIYSFVKFTQDYFIYPKVPLLLGAIRDVRTCLKKFESKEGNLPSGRARRCESNGRRYKGPNSVSAHLPTHTRNTDPSDDRASVSRPLASHFLRLFHQKRISNSISRRCERD